MVRSVNLHGGGCIELQSGKKNNELMKKYQHINFPRQVNMQNIEHVSIMIGSIIWQMMGASTRSANGEILWSSELFNWNQWL